MTETIVPGSDPVPEVGEVVNIARSDERLAWVVRDSPVVRGVQADQWGGIVLRLSSGQQLEVFPNDSVESLYARVLAHY